MVTSLKPSRYPSRATEDKKALYEALDTGLFCTVAFVRENIPHQIPTGYCRIDDKIYIHASAKSGFMDSIVGQTVSFSVTHMDGLILAPTAFDHSFNYRSAIGFSEAKEITDEDKKMEIFKIFTDRYIPGRIADVGDPTSDQIAITRIAELDLNKAAVKIRIGDSGTTDPEKFGKWVGEIPVKTSYGSPIPDEGAKSIPLPDYIRDLLT